MSPTSGSRGSRPCASRALPPTSAAAAPAAPSPASATGCGTSRRPRRSKPATRPEILAADLSSFVLDLAVLGRRRSRARSPSSIRRRARRWPRRKSAARRARRHRRRRPHHRRGPSVAAAAAAAAARAHGGRCRRDRRRPSAPQRSPPCSTERGLGGNDVDLGHRLDVLHRDRSRRAQEARAMAQRWAEIAQGGGARGHLSRGANKAEPSPGLLLALAYPDRIAKSRGAGGGFLLANGRGANIEASSALARAPFLAVGEIVGSAAQGRIVLAAASDAGGDRGALCQRHRSGRRHRFRSGQRKPARPTRAPSRRRRARRAAVACGAERRDRAHAGGRHRTALASTGCRGRKRWGNGATG